VYYYPQAKIFDPSVMAQSVGLPPDNYALLVLLAVLAGCDYTRHKKGRTELLKQFGIMDKLADISSFLVNMSDEEKDALEKGFIVEEYKDFSEAALYSMELYSCARPYPENLSNAFMERLIAQGMSEQGVRC